MASITEDMIVRDIVVRHPQTRQVFERRGVDYCCNGQMPLKAAARRAGADYEATAAELERAIAGPAPLMGNRDWSAAGLTDLADHILQSHHAFLKRQMPRIDGLLDAVASAHKPHADMLLALRRVFDGLRGELDQHMMKEEMILFPYIKQLDEMAAGRQEFTQMHCGTVANPIAQMEHEHDAAGEALAELRRITADYSLPDDACPTFAELYKSLEDLEADLHEHIHLENNILFPRSIEAEAGLSQG